jgi:hypothetical protein
MRDTDNIDGTCNVPYSAFSQKPRHLYVSCYVAALL